METLVLIAALLLASATGETNDLRHVIIDTGQPSSATSTSTPPATDNDARNVVIDIGVV